MGTEIERKFLIDAKRFLTEMRGNPPMGLHSTLLTQGYLSFEPAVRVRVKYGEAELTVKGKGLLVRPEFNFRIAVQEGDELLRLCKGAIIEKDRYKAGAAWPWEVDEFHGALKGLWLAEIELTHPDAPFDRPVWLGQEVTEDERFSNANLAQNGIAGLEGFLQDV